MKIGWSESPFLPCQEVPTLDKTGLVVLNFLHFCLSLKLLTSPSYLNEILAGYSNLGCMTISNNLSRLVLSGYS